MSGYFNTVDHHETWLLPLTENALLPSLTGEFKENRTMAKVLIYNNFASEDRQSILVPSGSTEHQYVSAYPGRWQSNPYSKKKHSNLYEYFQRFMACLILWRKWRDYDVLLIESATNAYFICLLCYLRKGQRKLVITSFNMPRHRTVIWRLLGMILFRQINHIFVHSKADIDVVSEAYNLPKSRFSFIEFAREEPSTGPPDPKYLFPDRRDFIISFGGNGRDYKTFVDAVRGTPLSVIIIAREYNLENIELPPNVRAFCNIPLEQCDRLVSLARFTVFTFDGSEPSCGQISIVTSFMLGKPVICTDWIGVNDYVENGRNGLFTKMRDVEDLKEKMMALSTDNQLFKKLAVGARYWAERNARPAYVQDRIERLVTNLVKENDPPG